MSAGIYNFTVEQNASLSFSLTILQADGVTPVDLTTYTFKGLIKQNLQSVTSVPFTFVVSFPLTGVVAVSLTSSDTSKLVGTSYIYDIIGESAGLVYRFLQGQITVSLAVTGA